MIVVGGRIHFETEDREALFEAIRQMMADSQAEEGCLAYEFSKDLTEPNVLHLYEVWENDEVLQAHLDSEHFKVFYRDIFPFFVERDITRYNAQVAE